MNESTFDNVVDGGRVRRPPAPFLWLGAAGFAAVGTSILYGATPGLNCPLFAVGMSLLLWRFDADRGSLLRFYTIPSSPIRHARLQRFYADWAVALKQLAIPVFR